ncbi:LTA synthase family protein [Clostridium sp. 'White wine YQ']|uniref:LTA synthase family protein n=1 Tax=Clostridium sp. 'White wine YQ' TaxID=3027474 RepID=UPI002366DAC3|nr:LTA synthase family protein [Clostridium sp. 'White wine YQ']MDD7794023.1 LTA synthase family protein [Clostridium sp. 'White wine YQ']
MLAYNTNKEKRFLGTFRDTIKDIVHNKYFIITFILIFLKSILFMALISDDKANGINPMRVFYSFPPFLVYFSFILIFLSFGFLFSKKGQAISFLVLNVVFTIFIIGDLWYFRSNSSFISLYMLKMTSNLDNLGSSIISMVRLVDLAFIIDIVVLLIMIIRDKQIKVKRNLLAFLLALILPILYLTYAHIKIDTYNKGFENQMIFRKSWSPNQTISNLTPIGYHIFDSYNYYKESKPYELSSEEKKQTEDWFSKKKENLPDNKYFNSMQGKNVLIIQWESLENFVIGQKVNGQEITPNLNRILKNSYYFDNFHEQTWNGTSSDGEIITNTSTLPVREGATAFRYPGNQYQYSFPNIFKNMGYSTFASHPDKGSYWNWMPVLKSVGYEKTADSTNYNIDEVINLGISDRSYLSQYADKLKELKAPFLSYTVTLTSHSPFELPEADKTLKLPSNLENTKLGGYFQCINYTDKYIGDFFDKLDKEGILKNTVVVIYGDHEGVHKFYGDEVQKTSGLEPWMKENNREVPLIIYNDSISGEVKHVQGGQVDTLPTVAYLFGVNLDKESNKTVGRNLLNTKKDFTILETREFVGTESYNGEKEDMLKAIDLSDKLIRANYYK